MLKEKTKEEQEFLKKIGQNLTNILMRKGKTICELSKETGVSSACLYKVSWGETNPNLIVLMRICQSLNITINDLIG